MKRREREWHLPCRYCALDDLTPEIVAAGGYREPTEIDGMRALVRQLMALLAH